MNRLKFFILMIVINVAHHWFIVPSVENSKGAGVLAFLMTIIFGLALLFSFLRLFFAGRSSGGGSSGGDFDFDFGGGGDGGGGGD